MTITIGGEIFWAMTAGFLVVNAAAIALITSRMRDLTQCMSILIHQLDEGDDPDPDPDLPEDIDEDVPDNVVVMKSRRAA